MDGLFRQNAHTHSNGTVSLTFTEHPNMKHKTQKQRNIVRTRHYNCAYSIWLMAVLIIFHVILQTVINLMMLSIRRQWAFKIKKNQWTQN